MSVTVLAPTAPLPPVRRQSMWGKMFGNFKMGKHDDHYETEPALLGSDSPRMSKTRLASISTGVDTAKISYKRNASIAMVKESRSCSAPLPQVPSPSKSRATSIASIKTRRSSRAGRRASWWRSANHEADEFVPAVPAIDRKYSLFGSHNPDVEAESTESTEFSLTGTRRPSYVPRNAASSFLKTTTPLSSEEKAEVIRRASVADTRSASVSNKSPVKSHRPAPLKLNNNKISNDSTADYGMFSMAGVCEIEEPSDLVSPRGSAFSVASAPRSPTDTIMEVDVEIIDSAKNSPELLPVKGVSNVAVVELVA